MGGRGLIVALLWMFGVSAAWGEVPVRSERSLRQQFESYVELLQKEVLFSKAKEKKQKFALLSQALLQMKTLRVEMTSLTAAEVAPMDTLISALEALPSQKAFKKKNCAQYAQRLPQETAAQVAVDFLQTLCQP